LNVSTVHRVLTRYRCLPLRWVDPATGAPVRAHRRKVIRYERQTPGELIHVDVRKLGRIPDGGGHKVLSRAAGRANRSAHRDPTRRRKVHGRPNLGYAFLHHALDDHSRLVYSEILTNETKETTTGFMTRALDYFTSCGITVERVLSDNGSPYRSKLFNDRLTAAGVAHKYTRPYRPQTNGKVERFNRTLQEEWAYARPYLSEAERVAAYPAFLHTYNFHRGHTSLKGASPADRVTNLAGQYT
jgi:transposase InsO family protein